MSRTVNPRIPLSLLEAIRRMDTPQDEGDTEYVAELRNKRLGLSDTVYLQIGKYTDALKRGQQVPVAEASGLGTLISRRPDSLELFRSAGSILANDAYESIAAPTRSTINAMPGFVSRPLALKSLSGIVEKYFGGELHRNDSALTLNIADPVTLDGSKSNGCVFYEEALRELIRLLVGTDVQVEHVKCVQRDDGSCEWRAEWRTP
ncbi:MAG: hypothetical protein ABIS03_10890 [Gemmatimonadaceae bacterium]